MLSKKGIIKSTMRKNKTELPKRLHNTKGPEGGGEKKTHFRVSQIQAPQIHESIILCSLSELAIFSSYSNAVLPSF